MALWNQSLGKPLLDGLTATYVPAVIETPMESGPRRRTLLSAAGVTEGTVTFSWTLAQKQTWELFYMFTIRQGTVEVSDFPIDLVDGIAPHRAYLKQFTQQTQIPDGRWLVTIPFEIPNRVAA